MKVEQFGSVKGLTLSDMPKSASEFTHDGDESFHFEFSAVAKDFMLIPLLDGGVRFHQTKSGEVEIASNSPGATFGDHEPTDVFAAGTLFEVEAHGFEVAGGTGVVVGWSE